MKPSLRGRDSAQVGAQNLRAAGVVIPHRAKVQQRAAAWLVFLLERFLTATVRWRWKDESQIFSERPIQPVIYCIWHNRLALCMALFRKYPQRRQPERRLAALISASKDGAFLASILERFGVQPVRGSSSRRGGQALLELTGWINRGYDVAITPDGPRGPRYIAQPGVISLAQLTGAPIIPVRSQVSWTVNLKSWDRFQIPLPFSRCEAVFGPSIRVEKNVSEAERAALTRRLQECLGDSPRNT